MGIYDKIPRIPIPGCLPMRFLVSVESFMGLTICYVLRNCLSIALIRMATAVSSKTAIDTESCPFDPAQHENVTKGEFTWSEKEQSQVLSGMFVGYSLAMIPSGIMGDFIGAGPMMSLGVFISSILTVLTPLAAYHSPLTLAALRVIFGVCQAMVYSCLHCIVAAWVPPAERGTWGSVVFSGSHSGSFINGILTGTLLGPLGLHWKYVFYIYGIIGFAWTFIFVFTVPSTPFDCPHLSEKEKKVFEEAGMLFAPPHERLKCSTLNKVLTNLPTWAILIAMIGHDWGMFMLVTLLPKFMYSILHFKITKNAYSYASIFLCIWLVGIITGVLADLVDRKRLISRTLNRKIGTTIASVGPSFGLLLSVYSNCSVKLAMVALFVGSALMGFFYSSLKGPYALVSGWFSMGSIAMDSMITSVRGQLSNLKNTGRSGTETPTDMYLLKMQVNPIDVAPRYSGLVGSVSQTAGALAGFCVTSSVGLMTPDGTLSQWRWVMWVALIIMSVTNVFYVLFATADIQAFNSPEDAERIKKEKEAKKAAKEAKKSGKKPDQPAAATSDTQAAA